MQFHKLYTPSGNTLLNFPAMRLISRRGSGRSGSASGSRDSRRMRRLALFPCLLRISNPCILGKTWALSKSLADYSLSLDGSEASRRIICKTADCTAAHEHLKSMQGRVGGTSLPGAEAGPFELPSRTADPQFCSWLQHQHIGPGISQVWNLQYPELVWTRPS